MDQETESFFSKHHVTIDLVKYVIKEPDRCAVYIVNGDVLYYYHALKKLIAALPPEEFLHINRGIVVAGSQIAKVRGREYIMADGKVFSGRVQDMPVHRRNRLLAEEAEKLKSSVSNIRINADFTPFDDLPAPFFIISPREDKKGGMDYTFRYCNKAMADMEYTLPHSLFGRSLFDVFVCCDSRWLECFAEVAKTGKTVEIPNFQPDQGRIFRCRCYQVEPGYCGCLLI